MAINLANKYPGRANPESVDYPSGSFKNRTTPDSKDGMILEQSWANDFLGARDAILSEAGIVADGEVETAQKSQVLEALNKLYKALSTTDAAGIIQLATAAEAQALTNDFKALTPATLAAAFGGANSGVYTDSGFVILPGQPGSRVLIQWGAAPPRSGERIAFTVAFGVGVSPRIAFGTAYSNVQTPAFNCGYFNLSREGFNFLTTGGSAAYIAMGRV